MKSFIFFLLREMKFALFLSFIMINAEKISFQLKDINFSISGERGEINMNGTIRRTKIDEHLWYADPNSLYTISISKKVFASVPLGQLQKNGFNDEIMIYRDDNG